MGTFIKKNLLFGSLVIFTLIFLELYNRDRRQNELISKQEILEQNSKDIEVLIVGNSHIRNGVVPKLFSKHAVNAAFGGSSLFYDKFMVEKYLKELPNCEILVIGVSYHTLATDLDRKATLAKRFELYHYLGARYKLDSNPLELRNYSILFTIKPAGAIENVLKDMSSKNPKSIYENLGFTPFTNQIGEKKLKINAPIRIGQHHNQMKTSVINENISYLKGIANFTAEKKVKLIVVTPPVTDLYHSLKLPEFSGFSQIVDSLSQTLGFEYIDFSNSNLFSRQMFKDSDHLNLKGANLLTTQLIESLD